MQIENVVITTRPLFSTEREFELGEGVPINVLIASNPLIEFLKEEYEKDPSVLKGHIQSLLERKTDYNKSK